MLGEINKCTVTYTLLLAVVVVLLLLVVVPFLSLFELGANRSS